MDNSGSVPGEVVSDLGQTGKQVVKEVVNLSGSIAGTALNQIMGQKTTQEIEQAKSLQAQNDAAAIASIQSQLAQRVEMNRQARRQTESVRAQELSIAKQKLGGLPTSSLDSDSDTSHKSLERRSAKRHG